MKYLMIGVVLVAILTSCSDNISVVDGYTVKKVNIEIDNYKVNISTEGNREIDVDEDGSDDLGLGFGYFRSDTMLETFFFSIEPLKTNILISRSEFLDTLYECKPNQEAEISQTTTFNSSSSFICNDSVFLEEVETYSEYYPTIFDSNEIEYNNIIWSNDKLTMSRCEKRTSNSSGTVSIVHDFWVNQKEKYLYFEIRDNIVQKGFLKLDSDESGSYRIYEIGLEDI